jgi:hypothetical protein
MVVFRGGWFCELKAVAKAGHPTLYFVESMARWDRACEGRVFDHRDLDILILLLQCPLSWATLSARLTTLAQQAGKLES